MSTRTLEDPSQLAEPAAAPPVSRWQKFQGRARELYEHPNSIYGIAPTLLCVLILGAIIAFSISQHKSPGATARYLLAFVVIEGTPLALLAMGAGLVLAGGGVDIATAGVATFAGVLYSVCTHYFVPPWSIVIGIVAAVSFGIFSGFLIGLSADRKRSSLIVSWGLAVIWTAAALIVASRIGKVDSVSIAADVLPPDGYWQWATGLLPPSGPWLFAIVLFAVLVLLHEINLPRQLRAIGGDRRYAAYAGVRVTYVTVASYVCSGVLAAIAGIMWANITRGGTTTGLLGRELIAISVAVMGGTVMNGGYLFLPSVAAAAWFWATTRLILDGTELNIAGDYQRFVDSSLFALVFLLIMLIFGRRLAGRTFIVHVSQD